MVLRYRHDHFYYIGKGCEIKGGWTRQNIDGDQEDDGIKLVKSGTDFRELSIVECEIGDSESGDRKIIKKVEGENAEFWHHDKRSFYKVL